MATMTHTKAQRKAWHKGAKNTPAWTKRGIVYRSMKVVQGIRDRNRKEQLARLANGVD